MCRVLLVASALLLVTGGPALAGPARLSSRLAENQRRQSTVLAGLERHRALARLDLQFCGSGSESQVSRGPLGCGFPVVGDHPWLVALGFQGEAGAGRQARFMCSGALISDQHVVTSARCALGVGNLRMTTARLGEYDFHTKRDCLWYAPEQCTESFDVDISGVMVHPDFKKRGSDASAFDVAVVRLARPVTLRHGVLPICLPMFPLRRPPHRQMALTLGLSGGKQPAGDAAATCCQCDRDRSATSHVMDQQKLDVFNVSAAARPDCQYRLLSERPGQPARCLGAGTPCLADLGGPLVAADRFGSSFYLLGVASVRPASSECGRPGAAVTYAPVQPHVTWILDSIERLT